MSVAQEVLTYLPEIAAVGGYVAGQAAEQVSRIAIRNNRAAALGGHEGVSGDRGKQPVWRRSLAQLAIIGAVAGGATGEIFVPADAAQTQPAVLVTVADHSFMTGQDGNFAKINTIAESMNDSDTMHVSTLLARNYSHSLAENDQQISSDRPYGASSVDTTVSAAIEQAFSQSATIKSTGLKALSDHAAGVLVITDGNSAGNVKDVVAKAKKDGDIPVYVANTGSDAESAKDLQAIAEQTGGHYWEVGKDAGSTVETIKDKITPQLAPEKPQRDRLPWIAAAIALWGAAGLQFTRRKRETAIS